jgi:hypothetical protein
MKKFRTLPSGAFISLLITNVAAAAVPAASGGSNQYVYQLDACLPANPVRISTS